MPSSLSHCGQLVRAHDRDRFLLSLFAPVDSRPALWALFAFNYEIARTREVVTETRIGSIRLQWWREAIGRLYDNPQDAPEHEILKALAPAIARYQLPREEFETLIYAREFDLEDVAPATMDGLLSYADYTAAPLTRLAVRIAGGDPDYEPVQPVAVNFALAGLIRAVPFMAVRHRCYMPADLMERQGIPAHRFYDFPKESSALKDIIKAVFVHFVPRIRPRNRFLRAVQALARLYMNQIRDVGYDPFHPRLAQGPRFKELKLWTSWFWLW